MRPVVADVVACMVSLTALSDGLSVTIMGLSWAQGTVY